MKLPLASIIILSSVLCVVTNQSFAVTETGSIIVEALVLPSAGERMPNIVSPVLPPLSKFEDKVKAQRQGVPSCMAEDREQFIGNYDSSMGLESVFTYQVVCNWKTALNVGIEESKNSGSLKEQRVMTGTGNNHNQLVYDIYSTPDHTKRWDMKNSVNFPNENNESHFLPFYIQIPEGQKVEPGYYVDTIKVQIHSVDQSSGM